MASCKHCRWCIKLCIKYPGCLFFIPHSCIPNHWGWKIISNSLDPSRIFNISLKKHTHKSMHALNFRRTYVQFRAALHASSLIIFPSSDTFSQLSCPRELMHTHSPRAPARALALCSALLWSVRESTVCLERLFFPTNRCARALICIYIVSLLYLFSHYKWNQCAYTCSN